MSSILGRVGSPYQSAYVSGKHGILGLSACLRQELSDVPAIRVCTVLPGPVDTPLFRQAANYTGRRPKPVEPVLRPERVARAIVRCVRRPKREVRVGWSTRVALAGERVAPALAERIAARGVERRHFTAERAAASSGNLHAPDREHADLHGGWRDATAVRSAGAWCWGPPGPPSWRPRAQR